MDPAERLIFLTNPKAWAEAQADKFKFHTVNGGDSVAGANGSFKTAPKLITLGDQTGTQTADGVNWTGRRDPTHEEDLTQARDAETGRHNVAGEVLGRDTLTESGRHNKADEGISYGNLGVARGRLGEEMRHDRASEGNAAGHLALEKQTAGKALTQGQATDGFLAGLMSDSSKKLGSLEGKNYDPSRAVRLPVMGGVGEDTRSYDAAADQWTQSMLHLMTGAAANKDEVHSARSSYFPQLGDSAGVRQQKAQMRANAEKLALSRAGPGAAMSASKTFNYDKSGRRVP